MTMAFVELPKIDVMQEANMGVEETMALLNPCTGLPKNTT